MTGYYAGKVKVVGADMMCFPARPGDLEPLSCSSYDPYAWMHPEPGVVETIDSGEWNLRRNAMFDERIRASRIRQNAAS